MNIEKLKKEYDPKTMRIRRVWVNLFNDISKRNKLQLITVLVYLSFLFTVILGILNFNLFYIPFMIGCSFILVSNVYFRIYPLSWKEMTDNEKAVFRIHNELPFKWELDDN